MCLVRLCSRLQQFLPSNSLPCRCAWTFTADDRSLQQLVSLCCWMPGVLTLPLLMNCLRHVSIVSPNETELKRLTGLPADTEQQLWVAAAALQARAQQQQQKDPSQQQQRQQQDKEDQADGLQVLLKLGTAGSMWVPSSSRGVRSATAGPADDDMQLPAVIKQAAVKAPQVVDTTGEWLSHTGCHVMLC